MSLINQMLQDLEKRRASATERAALPNQVRVLPRSEKPNRLWWVVAAGAVAVALTLWLSVTLRGAGTSKQLSPVSAAEDERGQDAKYLSGGPAARLALDLSEAPPAQAPARAANPALPITRSEATSGAVTPPLNPPVAAAAVVAAEAAPVVAQAAAKPAAIATENKQPVPAPAVAQPAAGKPRAVEANAEARVQSAQGGAQIDKRMQQLTPAQMAENEYREAANFLVQGRVAEAQESFRQALQHNPAHTGARQGLFGLLIEAKRNGEAEQTLRDGLKINPNQPGFSMALARLQLDRNDVAGATETLQGSLAGAQNSPDYLAFYAALLQRQSRHREAAEQYQAALRLAPQSGVWLMGMGISLQALGRNADAQDAFRRAKASNSLSAELQSFVEQRLRQLQ